MFGSGQKVTDVVFIGTLTIFLSFQVTSLPLVPPSPSRDLMEEPKLSNSSNRKGNISVEYLISQGGTRSRISSIKKREKLAQEAVMSSLRRRTIGRLQAPCAGVSDGGSAQLGGVHTSLYVSIVTADALLTLTEEIKEAVSTTSAILKLYEERGLAEVVIPNRVKMVSYRLPEKLAVATGMLQPHETLTAVYRELSRAVLVLELIISTEGWPALTNGMEALKERQLFNILCGTKVLIDERMAGTDTKDILDTSLPLFTNRALRYVRDYVSMLEISAMLKDSVSLMNLISAHL